MTRFGIEFSINRVGAVLLSALMALITASFNAVAGQATPAGSMRHGTSRSRKGFMPSAVLPRPSRPGRVRRIPYGRSRPGALILDLPIFQRR
jgi:hypothetical protein